MAEVGWWLTTWKGPTEGIEKIEVPALQVPFRTSSLALPLAHGGAHPAQAANHSPTREKQRSETEHGPPLPYHRLGSREEEGGASLSRRGSSCSGWVIRPNGYPECAISSP